MRERAAALAAFVVAVGRGRAALAGRDQLAVRAVAHRASGIAPLEAGVDKNAIEPLGFGLPLHRARTGRNHAGNDRTAPLEHPRRSTQILDAAVGARADENPIDGD